MYLNFTYSSTDDQSSLKFQFSFVPFCLQIYCLSRNLSMLWNALFLHLSRCPRFKVWRMYVPLSVASSLLSSLGNWVRQWILTVWGATPWQFISYTRALYSFNWNILRALRSKSTSRFLGNARNTDGHGCPKVTWNLKDPISSLASGHPISGRCYQNLAYMPINLSMV